MKKVTFLVFLLKTVSCFSQAITVDTNTYTVPQLVQNILINSPCISATNITWRTGTNFGSTNGIGYFQNTNPNFPFQDGVILSTGNVAEAPGPNASFLSSGSSAWTGDASLEAILAASGIPMTSTNATVLEFDFVPLSSNFDFDFLFASEEYGNFQCQFSDAFAFLLTNMNTGVTTNLAVVPGTNDPISVVTIRDFIYNSTCPSVNSQYFGSFNGGSNSMNSAINFNGQTITMNASAVLTPNIPYRIKLVIADRSDFNSDSAIFLSSNSFNIGQDVLGNDLTIANNTAICNGQTQIINSGLNPAVYSFVWKKNGVVISGQNGPSLTVTQPGLYELTFTNIAFPCQTITNDIVVEYFIPLNSPNPINIYKCNSGQANYIFDLSYNTPIVKYSLNANTLVSYHASIANANSNSNPIPLTYSSAGNETIFVRISNPDTGCSVIKSFQLLVVSPPVANQPNDLSGCMNSSGNHLFNLNSLTTSVLNGQSPAIYKVRYYYTLANANSNTNVTNGQITTSGGTAYIRVQLFTDPSCYSITSVNLNVLPLPLVDDLDDVISCNQYILPVLTNGNYFTVQNGTIIPLFAGDIITQTSIIYINNTSNTTPSCSNETNFKVTIIKPEELQIKSDTYCNSYTLPNLQFGEYYTEANGNGVNLPNGTILTTSQTVYFHFVSPEPPFCVIDAQFDIVIIQSQTVPTIQNIFDCTSYTLPNLSFGNYYDAPNGTGNQLLVGSVINSSKTVYIYGTTGICASESSFEVVIGINFPTSVNECVSFTLPQLTVGNYYTGPVGTGNQIPSGSVINTTQTIYVYAVSQSQPNCTDNYNFTITITLPVLPIQTNISVCDTYTLPPIAIGNYYTGINGSGTLLNAGDTITTSQMIYVYLNNNNGCQNEMSFDVTIYQTPIIDSRSEIDACQNYTLTNLTNGNYFTGTNGSGTQLNGGDVLITSQLIYIYAEQNGCSAETSFQLNIFTIYAFEQQDVTVCDGFTLPTLTGNNKYYTQPNGPYGSGTEIAAGTVITTTQTIYIFIESGERINCTDETSFTVTIIQTPIVLNQPNVNTCNSYTLPSLATGNYYTQSNKNGMMLNAGDVITSTQTLYVYAESGTTPNCFDEKSFTITIFNVDELQNVTTCDSFSLPNLIIGNYYNGPNGTGGIIPQGSVISNNKTIYIFANSGFNPNCNDETSFIITIIPTPIVANQPNLNTCNSYTLPSLATGNYYTQSNKNGMMLNAGDVITSTQTLYVYAESGTTPNCFDEKNFTITIFNVDELQNVTKCESYSLPNLIIGNYYNGPNGTGGMITQGSTISNNKTIYIFANSGFNPNCSDESSFVVTILAPVVNSVPLTNRTVCDDDGINDGIFNFNLTTLNTIILGTQTGSEFSISYYESNNDAIANVNSVSSSSSSTIYVRVANTLTSNCFDIKPISIIVNKIPEPKPIDGIICIKSTNGQLINPYTISSGLSTTNHTFKWLDEQGQIVGTGTNYTAILPGIYSIIAINTTTGCSSEETFVTVSTSEPALVTYVLSADFNESQSISVIATGTGGDYEYQLDDGQFQDNPVFDSVMSGIHTITVRDKNGCGISITKAIVVNYPHYFTPNGDGYNETWNIKDLQEQEVATIYIYDRFGKLLKKIKPSEQGWDGTYNNNLMPSDDYWFLINYQKDGLEKEFRAHFTLKR